MTTLSVELSSTLQATLGKQGVWAYAVYFEDGAPTWTSLVENGSVQDSGSVSLALPDPWNGGKVYFLVQSQASTQPYDLETLITQESEINWGNASSYDFRYDSFEVSLLGQTGDAGNLTSVEGFGLPMELQVSYTDGSDSRGYKVGASTLFSDFDAIDTSKTYTYAYTDGPLEGSHRVALSPTQAVGLNEEGLAFQASDWASYVDALKSTSGIEISGFFNGAPDANGVWHDAGFYAYTLEWDSDDSVFWLSPQENSEIQGYIRLTADDLQNSIYSTLGDVGIYTDKATPYTIIDHDSSSMNSGENNQWGGILTQFLTGFTAGYYGQSGVPENTEITGTVDLDKNWNWDPDYAFGKNLEGSAPSYQYYDPYSEIFYFNSNSYGSGYSDNVMSNYADGGPLISVYDTQTGQNVDEIAITIYDDSETPGGYVTPVIYNYLDAGEVGYQAPDLTGTGANVVLNFGNKNTVLDGTAAVTLEIYDGEENPGEPSWSSVTFSPADGDTLWQTWNIGFENGAYTATAAGTQTTGSMLINQLPVLSDGVTWYRLTIGSGDDAKTFNLYTTTEGGAFVNPAQSGNEGALAIDGLATIALPSSTDDTIGTFSIDFLYSGSSSLPPDNLVRNTDATFVATLTQPDAPVAGTVSGSTFTALSGQDAQVSNTVTTTSSDVAFGWTGLNSASGTASWISGYTNKADGLNPVRLDVTTDDGTAVGPITAYADIDGQWQTDAQSFGNGTYTITATEYALSDTGFTTPIGRASAEVTLTVDAPELSLARAGAALALDDDGVDATTGSWIRLEATDADADSGTTLLVYATNDAGERVGRDGETGDGVTVEDATVGTIGAVSGDDGLDLLSGAQSVHLLAGQQLRFAALSGNGDIDDDPDVRIVSQGDGTMTVEVAGFELTAEVDNTLDDSATLATTQRALNAALTYLEQGETVDVRVTGHCANENTLGFVRFDIAADGSWSVDGVDYGDTDAFETAVLDNLDDAFTFTGGGGQFDQTLTWTVAGSDGYYAPVLLTETGETFVIGDANPGGHDYIRLFGENTFGFEDVAYDDGADFDYNDLVVRITPTEADLAI